MLHVTPLMNEIRAIEQHGALILAEDEEFMSINHSKKKMILNDGKDLNGDEIDREELGCDQETTAE